MWFYGALQLLRSFSARTKFCQQFPDVFYSLFISSSATHLIAELLASVTADTSFKVFGLTRLRIEPSIPASKANALNMQVDSIRNFNGALNCQETTDLEELKALAHGVGRVVGALGSEADFAGSMLN